MRLRVGFAESEPGSTPTIEHDERLIRTFRHTASRLLFWGCVLCALGGVSIGWSVVGPIRLTGLALAGFFVLVGSGFLVLRGRVIRRARPAVAAAQGRIDRFRSWQRSQPGWVPLDALRRSGR